MVVQMLQVACVVLQERKSINDQILCYSTFKPYDVYYILYVYKKKKIILHLHHILYWYTLKTPSLYTYNPHTHTLYTTRIVHTLF